MTALEDRILILDGAMGTMIQKYGLAEDDYRGDIFAGYGKELRGNNECLNLTRPDIIKAIHKEYIEAGADIIVVGNALEKSTEKLKEFADAVHDVQ